MTHENSDSNQLLRFMNMATTNIQEALGRQGKVKKVNHRKYIQKRLQNGARCTRKTRSNASLSITAPGRQPVATMYGNLFPSASWASSTQSNTPDDYDLFQLVTPSYRTTNTTVYNNRPSSAQGGFDPEIESLLSEFGLESPSQATQYADSPDLSRRGSSISTASGSSQVPENIITAAPPNDYMAFSPPSDFSDIDDSAYSSHSASPICYQQPSPPSVDYYHQHITASCEWLHTCSTSAVHVHPNTLAVLPPSSITEIMELVSTP